MQELYVDVLNRSGLDRRRASWYDLPERV